MKDLIIKYDDKLYTVIYDYKNGWIEAQEQERLQRVELFKITDVEIATLQNS